MEKLCGPESLQVVCHRFSDGVDVVKCISGFIKEMGDVEQSYSNSLEKLVKSHHYNLHSNIIMQLIGSNPYEEIGTIKHTWSELGDQLNILARMHADKAKAYLDKVRKPLLDMAPSLEDARKELKNKARVLKSELETAASKHEKEKQKWLQICDNLERSLARIPEETATRAIAEEKAHMKNTERVEQLKGEMKLQEQVYRDAHKKHVEMKERFDREVKDLYKTIHARETERVNAVKTSLMEFTRTLSNTAPAYLESMQKITNTASQIDCNNYIESFVEQHSALTTHPDVPRLQHHAVLDAWKDKNEDFPSGEDTLADVPPVDLSSSRNTTVSSRSSSTVPPMSTVEEHSTSIPPSSEVESRLKIHQHHTDRRHVTFSSSSSSSSSSSFPASPRSKPKKSLRKPIISRKEHAFSPSGSTSDEPISQVTRAPTSQPTSQVTRAPTSQPTSQVTRTPSQVTRAPTSQVTRAPASQPTSQVTRTPTGQAPRTPTDQAPRTPTGQASRTPTGQAPRTPTGQAPRTPTGQAPRTSTGQAPRTPTGQAPRTPTSQAPRTPTSSPSQSVGTHPRVSEEDELFRVLMSKSEANDYYSLLGVLPEALASDLAQARRDRSRELHPDHFTNDELKKAKNQEKLARINHAFQDVLKNDESRKLYDRLCAFRKRFPAIMEQDKKGLEKAQIRLEDLKKSLKKMKSPQALLDELELALNLIETRMNKMDM